MPKSSSIEISVTARVLSTTTRSVPALQIWANSWCSLEATGARNFPQTISWLRGGGCGGITTLLVGALPTATMVRQDRFLDQTHRTAVHCTHGCWCATLALATLEFPTMYWCQWVWHRTTFTLELFTGIKLFTALLVPALSCSTTYRSFWIMCRPPTTWMLRTCTFLQTTLGWRARGGTTAIWSIWIFHKT